jgi:hypothetical protein
MPSLETAAYLAAESEGLPDDYAGEVTGAVGKLVHRLVTLPPDGADYRLAAALALKWGLWLKDRTTRITARIG